MTISTLHDNIGTKNHMAITAQERVHVWGRLKYSRGEKFRRGCVLLFFYIPAVEGGYIVCVALHVVARL